MQYEAHTPQAYLQQLTQDWRKDKLEQVRAIIQKHGPDLREGIEYKMLCFGDEQKNLFHLNAQRAYVSLYVGHIDKIEGARELLQGLDLGKGCIRIKKSTELADTGLEAFIQKTIEHWQGGGDTDC